MVGLWLLLLELLPALLPWVTLYCELIAALKWCLVYNVTEIGSLDPFSITFLAAQILLSANCWPRPSQVKTPLACC
jgi:hypothetical protein